MIALQEKYTDEFVEIGWDTKIKAMPSLQRNKPGLFICYKIDKMCFIVDVAVRLDVNTTKNYHQKNNNYVLPLTELKKPYPRNTFEILPIVLGATRLITTELAINLRKQKVKNIEETTDKCQTMGLIRSMEIIKSVMNMKNI